MNGDPVAVPVAACDGLAVLESGRPVAVPVAACDGSTAVH